MWLIIVIGLVVVAAVVVFVVRPQWSKPLMHAVGLHAPAPAPVKGEVPSRQRVETPRRPARTQPVAPASAAGGDGGLQSTPRVVPQRVEPRPVVTPSPPSTSRGDDPTRDYMEVGVLYARKGKYQKAEELFRKVVEQSPMSAEARNNLGFVYLQQGKYEAAEGEFKDALRFDPAYVLAYYNLACLYARKKMDVDAIIYLKRALEKDERVKLWAAGDEDFERLRSDDVFRELIGMPVEHPTGTGRN